MLAGGGDVTSADVTSQIDSFHGSRRPHVLMVTNHGLHEWSVTPGLPDTGGQNVYVNDMSAALVALGFRVTVANRGGYPHPESGARRTGSCFRGAWERIVYVEDSTHEFVRKEDMHEHIGELGRDLARRISEEADLPILIISHYWDGASVANSARSLLGLDQCPHVWIPHSLGQLKKENTSDEWWESLRIDERIEEERRLLLHVDYVVHTSRSMEHSLADAYGYVDSVFLPPCVDTRRFDPESSRNDTRALSLLSDKLGRSEGELASAPIVTEVSRTARSKRKDVLISAFARVHARVPEALLALTVDRNQPDLYDELTGLVDSLGLEGSVAVLGSIWEYIPSLYGHSAVYCTPSVMEGFGMSIQEAAACRVPAVSSDRVPFALEYLLGANPRHETGHDGGAIRVGEGAIVVPPNDVSATGDGIIRLLEDDELRASMGERAYRITVPAFSWQGATQRFLADIGVEPPGIGADG